MLKDITLGQYFPGNSFIHRLDPRTKLVGVLLYIIALFMASGWVSYGLMLAFLLVSIRISKVPAVSFLRGMRPLVVIVIFTAVLNLFMTKGETVIFHWAFLTLTKEGIVRAVQMVGRILMLVSGTFLMTYTTSPIALTDGLESLLNPLKKLHLPVHELAMIMCIALRFIPTLIEETDKIMSAQKARGADFESGKLMQRVRALIPILIPLFVSAFRRADELSTAMECRCYQGGEGRTKMKQLRYAGRDGLAYGVLVAVLAAVIVLGRFGL